jgi:hypothetical protein
VPGGWQDEFHLAADRSGRHVPVWMSGNDANPPHGWVGGGYHQLGLRQEGDTHAGLELLPDLSEPGTAERPVCGANSPSMYQNAAPVTAARANNAKCRCWNPRPSAASDSVTDHPLTMSSQPS